MLIEQAMIFALGALSMLLLSLLLIPSLSRRAMRLAQKRIELQLPLSPAEILAERDQLRAEYAVLLRQSEQKLEAEQATRVEAGSALGRLTLELADIAETNAALRETLAEQNLELAESRRQLNEMSGFAGASHIALREEALQHDRQREAFARLTNRYIELADQHDELKVICAGLEARNSGLELECGELNRQIQEVQRKLAADDEEMTLLRQERDLTHLEADNAHRLRGKMNEWLKSDKAHVRALEQKLSRANAALRSTQAELDEARDTLARLEQDRAGLRERYETLRLASHHDEAPRLQKIEDLKTEIAALQGALSVARDVQTLQKTTPGAPALLSPDDTRSLREAISQMAADVVRQNMSRDSQSPLHDILHKDHKTGRLPKATTPRSLAERILEH